MDKTHSTTKQLEAAKEDYRKTYGDEALRDILGTIQGMSPEKQIDVLYAEIEDAHNYDAGLNDLADVEPNQVAREQAEYRGMLWASLR